MKKIISQIKEFLKEDFNIWRYSISILSLIVLFYLQFSGSLKDFRVENNISYSNYYLGFLIATFSLFYFISIVKINLKQLAFIAFAVLILQLNYETKSLARDLMNYFDFDSRLYQLVRQTFINFQKAAILVLMLILPYLIQRKKLNSFYGFTSKEFDFKPYLIMLALMLPLIFIASYEPSFQKMYPRYRPGIAEELGLISKSLSVGIFESTYALRFVGVEAFWRGFLIIGGVLVFGRKAILPAACLYSVWHFGKPMGEAIGAFFGGYILGILAYHSKSIYGGIAIHYGVALLMEIAAWYWLLQK